jgi:uncharacterized membrane protein
MKLGHWHQVPSVRSGDKLTFGERAADKLKAAFGSWPFIILLNVIIIGWIALNVILPRANRWDIYPFILLNLGLSWLAAQQGGALQIAANRGDRISSEVALHSYQNGEKILQLNQQQMEILGRLDGLQDQVGALAATLAEQVTWTSAVAGPLAQYAKQVGDVHALMTKIAESPAPSVPTTDAEAVQAANSAAEVQTATARSRRGPANGKGKP